MDSKTGVVLVLIFVVVATVSSQYLTDAPSISPAADIVSSTPPPASASAPSKNNHNGVHETLHLPPIAPAEYHSPSFPFFQSPPAPVFQSIYSPPAPPPATVSGSVSQGSLTYQIGAEKLMLASLTIGGAIFGWLLL